MPEFSFNLVHVPKLTKTLNCQLIFNNIDCVIHDTCSKKMIDKTKLNDGLCLLTFPYITWHNTPFDHYINSILTHALDTSYNCKLWHFRLVHSSHAKLFELNISFPFIKPVNHISPCDVCFCAKQPGFNSLLVLMFIVLLLI